MFVGVFLRGREMGRFRFHVNNLVQFCGCLTANALVLPPSCAKPYVDVTLTYFGSSGGRVVMSWWVVDRISHDV